VGAPSLRAGERAIFFLKRDRRNAWRPVGLLLGVYAIRTDAQTGALLVNPPLVAGVTADTGAVVRGDVRRTPMTTEAFGSLVRAVAASRPPATVVGARPGPGSGR
jgi:hypothetical protein